MPLRTGVFTQFLSLGKYLRAAKTNRQIWPGLVTAPTTLEMSMAQAENLARIHPGEQLSTPEFAPTSWFDSSSNEAATIPPEIRQAVAQGGKTTVQAWREYRGLSPVQVAERAGLTVRYVLETEAGAAFGPHALRALAEALRVPPCFLRDDYP